MEDRGITFDQLQSMDVDYSASQSRAMDEHRAILDEFERKRRARTLAVPTDDGQVRLRLRELGEPITLFGEGPGDRRERLRELMSRMAGVDIEMESEDESSEGEEEEAREEFYTEGTEELYDARKWIAGYSLKRARERTEEHRAEVEVPVSVRKKVVHDFYIGLKVGYRLKLGLYSKEMNGNDLLRLYCMPTFRPTRSFLPNWQTTGHSLTFRSLPTLAS